MLKGIDQNLNVPIQKEITKEVHTETRHIASMQPQRGQQVWKYNPVTKELRPIESSDFEKVVVAYTGKTNKRLVMEKGCLYAVALNEKNAARKFLKLLSLMR